MGVPNKLSPAIVAKIKRLRFQDDVSVAALAERFGVSPDSIRRACQQESHNDVERQQQHVGHAEYDDRYSANVV